MIHFPYAVVRIGGGTFADLPSGDGASLRALRAAAASRGRLAAQALGLTEQLSARVPDAYQQSEQLGKAMLRIKRDVHNHRPVPPDLLQPIAGLISADLAASLRQFAKAAQSLREESAALIEVYGAELEAELQSSLLLAEYGPIAAAIRIINPAFAEAMHGAGKAGTVCGNRKAGQAANTLLRYALRTTLKTSPLASLGLIALVRPDPDGGQSGHIVVSGPVRHGLQIQLRMLEQWAAQLCADPNRLAGSVPIRLNRSAQIREGKLAWTYPKPRSGPKAAVSGTRLLEASSASGFVKLLAHLLADRAELSLDELRDRAVKAVPQLASNFSALIEQAWANKVIELAVPEELTPLGRIRCMIDAQRAALRVPLMDAFETCVAALAGDGDLVAFGRGFDLLNQQLGVKAGNAPAALVDDCVLDTASMPGLAMAFPGPLAQFSALVRLVPLLTVAEPMRAIERWLIARFVAEAGPGGQIANAASFVEGAAAALEAAMLQGPAADGSQKGFFQQLGISPDPSVEAGLEAVLTLIAAQTIAGTASLTCEALCAIVNAMPAASIPPRLAKLIHYQPIRDASGGVRYVVNAIYPGYASMFSRFLEKGSAELAAVRSYLCDGAAAGGFAELGGHFGFNANQHPQIAPRQLAIAPFHYGDDTALPLGNLSLIHDEDADALAFRDAAGKVIDLHYLGVIQPFMLPYPYLVIQAVSRSVVRVPKLDLILLERAVQETPGVVRAPRVQLDDLVLSRRCLAAAQSVMPDTSLDDFTYFRQFNAWADQCALPERMFYRFGWIAALHDGAISQTLAASARQDKPMPLDRSSPAQVRLFQKDSKASGLDVILSEALPDFGESLFQRDGQPIVGELGLELTVRTR